MRDPLAGRASTLADILAQSQDEQEKQNYLTRTLGVSQSPTPMGPPAPEPKPSLIDRLLSGVYIPPAPLGPNQRDIGGRYFLHGLMQAIAANHGGGGALLTGSRRTNGYGARPVGVSVSHEDPNADLKRAYIQAQIDAAKALGGARQARADMTLHPQPKTDPFEADKHGLYGARTDAAEALAESRRRPKATAGRGAGGGTKGGGGLTMAQRRAQINSLAQAEKQRVANNIKNKYRNVYDYNNPVTGTPEGKRIVDAAIARGIAQVEQEHARVLRELGAQYGMDQGENAPAMQQAPAAVDPNSPEGIAAAMRARK